MRNLIASFLIAAVTFPILRAAEPSRTLPLMVIETENHQTIVSKDNYIRATYYIDPCGVEGVQAIGTVDSRQSAADANQRTRQLYLDIQQKAVSHQTR